MEPFVDAADLILLDNRSCLFDPEGEKDPTAWQPAQEWLLSLRRQGKAVLMAHHTNRQGGARGHSKPEDALNLLINLARPDDYGADQGSRFVVTFEKSRGVHGAAVAPFTARLTPEGWHVEGTNLNSVSTRLCEYVRLMDQAGERVKSVNAAIRGASVNKAQGLKTWAELLRAGSIRRHPEGGFHAAWRFQRFQPVPELIGTAPERFHGSTPMCGTGTDGWFHLDRWLQRGSESDTWPMTVTCEGRWTTPEMRR